MNSLFNDIMSNNNDLISQFNKFKSTFQGNPREKVQQLLDSGQMSQSEYERLSKIATQLQSILMR